MILIYSLVLVLTRKWLFFLTELDFFPYSYFSIFFNDFEKFKFFFSINFMVFRNTFFLNFLLDKSISLNIFKTNFVKNILIKKKIFLKKKTVFFYKFIFFKNKNKRFKLFPSSSSNFFLRKFISFQKNNRIKEKTKKLSEITNLKFFFRKNLILRYFFLKKFPLTGYYFNRSSLPTLQYYYGDDDFYLDRFDDNLNLLKPKLIFKSKQSQISLFKKIFIQNYFYLAKNSFFWNIFFKFIKESPMDKLVDGKTFKLIEWPSLPTSQVNLVITLNFKKISLNLNKITFYSLEAFSVVYYKFRLSIVGKKKRYIKKFQNFSVFSSLLFSQSTEKKIRSKLSNSFLLPSSFFFFKKFNLFENSPYFIKNKINKFKIKKFKTFINYFLLNKHTSNVSKNMIKKFIFLIKSSKNALNVSRDFLTLSLLDIFINKKKNFVFFFKNKFCFFFIKNYRRFLYKNFFLRLLRKNQKHTRIGRKNFVLKKFIKKNKLFYLFFLKKKYTVQKKKSFTALSLFFRNISFLKYSQKNLFCNNRKAFFLFNEKNIFFSSIFHYGVSYSFFSTNKLSYFFNEKTSFFLIDNFYDFFFSRIDFPFIHSFDGFLYTYDKFNFESYPVKYCYLFKKTAYSFIFKNDLQNFIIKKHLKSSFNPVLNNFNMPTLSFFDKFWTFDTKFEFLENLENNNYLSKSYFYNLIRNDQSFKIKKKSHFEIEPKVNPIDHKIFMSYMEFLNDVPINFSIKKIKFKPGYQNIWREARECFKISLNIKLRYQLRLTKIVNRFKKIIKKNTYSLFENQLHNVLKLSKIIPDMGWAFTFIQNGSIFVNNKLSLNPFMQLFKNDFIQLIINHKYYIFYRWIIVWSTLHKFKFKAKINNKLNKKDLPDDKQKSFKTPLWVLRHRAFTDDVPKHIEVDYLTLSFFIVYEFHSTLEFDTTFFFQHRFPVINMYNWKYIN